MGNNTHPPKTHQYFFWTILAALSTFFAEVFSGSDMFPYFHPWGLLVVVPLYGLHILVLGHLVYRAGRPQFGSLVFAGMLFGLYEAYLTKVLWAPPWGDALIMAGVAPIETLVLVFWWHAWFSFIIPLVVAEKLFTTSQSLGQSLPERVGAFLNSWGGLALVMTFGGIFQSINSPAVGQSLLSGVSTVAVLIGLILLWRRITRGRSYTLPALLPDQKQFRKLMIPTAALYLVLGVVVRPEEMPDLSGHVVIWALYGLCAWLLYSSIKGSPSAPGDTQQAMPPMGTTGHWLLLGGLFPAAGTLSELVLAPVAHTIALIFWFGGIFFGIAMFIIALRQTLNLKGHHDA